MDRFWLKNYPQGVPADIDPGRYKSLIQLLDEAFKKYSGQGAYSFMGAEMTFGQLDQNSAAIGAWLQSKGFAKGTRVAIMMPNVLQYPVAMAGVLRAGYTVVNVNPLYTPRELEHQLKDSGAEAIFILENFATTLAAGDRQGADQDCRRVRDGRHAAFPQEPDRQLRRPQREKNGAGVFVAERVALERRAGRRHEDESEAGRMQPQRCRVPAVHRRNDRSQQGRHADSQERDRQHAAGRSVVPAGAGETEARRADDHSDRAAAVSHLRADVLRAAVDAYRRQESVDSESARYSGVRQGTRQAQVRRVPGGQHAVQRAAEQRRFQEARFQVADPVARRWYGGTEGRGGEVAKGHRHPDLRSLWFVGDVTGRHLQPNQYDEVHRLHRAADAVYRHCHSG